MPRFSPLPFHSQSTFLHVQRGSVAFYSTIAWWDHSVVLYESPLTFRSTQNKRPLLPDARTAESGESPCN